MTVLDDESAEILGDALLDAADKEGQEIAPITGPTSATPLEGLFQAGFLGRPALSLLLSEPSAADVLELSMGGEAGAGLGDESANCGWSETDVVSDDEDEDDDGGD